MPLDDKSDLRRIDPKTGRPQGLSKERADALRRFREGDPDALLRELGFSEEEIAKAEEEVLREIGDRVKIAQGPSPGSQKLSPGAPWGFSSTQPH